jgi:nucleoside-diphosphate-sugar epimerase
VTVESPAGATVLVLGASGFLGRHVHAAFATAGARVVPVSRKAHDGVALDLVRAGRRELAGVCAGADVVVNASGVVWGGTEQEMTWMNAELAERLAEVLAASPGRPRLVHLGSAYEYGPTPHGTSIDEEWPPAPASPYGRTKLRGTRAVLRAAEEDGLNCVVLRVSVACGPGAPVVSLPGLVAGHLADGLDDELRLAPLLAHRDLVDVRDVAGAVLAAACATRGTVTGKVVNIGGGDAVPVRSLVDLMISLSGRPVRVLEEAAASGARSDAQWQCLDITRARRLLGWAPRRTLAESMRDLLTAAGVPLAPPEPAARAHRRDRR